MIKDLLKLIFCYALPLFGIAMVLFIASESFPVVDDLLRGNYKGPTVTVINVVLVISVFVILCWSYKGFTDHKNAWALLLTAGIMLFYVVSFCFVWKHSEYPLAGFLTLKNLHPLFSVMISAAYSMILFAIASFMWPSDASKRR